MKYTYTDLMGQSKEIFDNQSEEVKETIRVVNEYHENESIKEVMNCIQEGQELKYITYTHN